ncbi:MAG: GGDEF domain-containing protein [Methylomonas sp.]
MRTMVIMLAVLSFMLSILLALASIHDRGIRGLKHWSAASFILFTGFALAFLRQTADSSDGIIVIGAALVSGGTALQLIGIYAFKKQICHCRILVMAIALSTLQTAWFIFIHPNINMRAVGNSLILATLNFASAKALLIRIRPPERTAHWLTGASFAILGSVHIARILTILSNPSAAYGLYQTTPINPLLFFTGGIIHLFISFGFIMMVNYRLSAELDELAATDPLTGVWNRRSLEHHFQHLLAHSTRHLETLSVIMLDVDYFKNINDHYGHQAGDKVLQHLSAIAKTEIRRGDYLARFGGEEFCLLLPATSVKEAETLAERLRLAYLNHPLLWQDKAIASSISLGVACSSQAGLDSASLLEAADTALYVAKQTGRNKTIIYGYSHQNQG